jgi:hypothetical protein
MQPLLLSYAIALPRVLWDPNSLFPIIGNDPNTGRGPAYDANHRRSSGSKSRTCRTIRHAPIRYGSAVPNFVPHIAHKWYSSVAVGRLAERTAELLESLLASRPIATIGYQGRCRLRGRPTPHMQGVPGSSPGASTNESLNQFKVFSEIASLSAFVPFVDCGGFCGTLHQKQRLRGSGLLLASLRAEYGLTLQHLVADVAGRRRSYCCSSASMDSAKVYFCDS